VPASIGGSLWEMGVGPLAGLGTIEPKMHKGGLLIHTVQSNIPDINLDNIVKKCRLERLS